MTMVHGIHNSEQMPAGEYESRCAIGTYAVSYPTYMTNCSVCHDDAGSAGEGQRDARVG